MKTKTTDTPRTDAALADAELIGYDCPLEFCRQLEREVARLREDKNIWREEANTWNQHYRDEQSKSQRWKQHSFKQEQEVERLLGEIQKLKTQTHYHHESYCRKCKEPK